ncbi:MAG: hypothetical protein WBD63_03360 [Phycisphaerae bacterium]
MPKPKRLPDHQAFLDELTALWPLAKGSLTEVRKPCIRPRCPACKAGRKHKAIFFSFPKGGKRVCRYVPAELAPLLRQAPVSVFGPCGRIRALLGCWSIQNPKRVAKDLV